MTKVLGGLLLVGSIVTVTLANFYRDRDMFTFQWKISKEAPLNVNIEPVSRGTVTRSIDAPGDVEAEVEVDIASQVVSRITRLPFREGQRVKKGELLVELDAVDFEAEVKSATSRVQMLESSIKLQEAELGKAKRYVEDFDRLKRSGAIGERELRDQVTLMEQEEFRLAMTRSELDQAHSNLTKVKENYQDTRIVSPIDGIVADLAAEEGEIVVVGTMNNAGTRIMTISDPSKVIVKARVDESDVPTVMAGQRAIIHLAYDRGMDIEGYVTRVAPKGERKSDSPSSADYEVATFEAEISIPSPPTAVRLGMTANVEIEVQTKRDVLVIPSQAVLNRRLGDLPDRLRQEILSDASLKSLNEDQASKYFPVVFVNQGGKASMRRVELGISSDTHVEIRGGLDSSDLLVVGPYRMFEKLKDGVPIKDVDNKN